MTKPAHSIGPRTWRRLDRVFDFDGQAGRVEFWLVGAVLFALGWGILRGAPRLGFVAHSPYWPAIELAAGGAVAAAGAALIVRRLHGLHLTGHLIWLFGVPIRVILQIREGEPWRSVWLAGSWIVLVAGVALLGALRSRQMAAPQGDGGAGGADQSAQRMVTPPRSLGRAFYEWRAERSIRRTGWVFVHSDGDAEHPPYSYSAGLQQTAGFPELVVSGLAGELARHVLVELARRIKSGETRLVDGSRVSGMIDNFDCAWRQVHPSQITPGAFGTAIWHRHLKTGRHDDVEAFQLVWPDRSGLFPWDPGCNLQELGSQPLFYEPLPSDQAPTESAPPV